MYITTAWYGWTDRLQVWRFVTKNFAGWCEHGNEPWACLKAGNLTSWVIVNFSGRILIHGVGWLVRRMTTNSLVGVQTNVTHTRTLTRNGFRYRDTGSARKTRTKTDRRLHLVLVHSQIPPLPPANLVSRVRGSHYNAILLSNLAHTHIFVTMIASVHANDRICPRREIRNTVFQLFVYYVWRQCCHGL